MLASMRVVYLTTEFPWPAVSGGPVRTLSQLRTVASLDEVDAITLVSVAERPVDPNAIAEFEATFRKLRVVPPIFHPVHLFEHARYVPRVLGLRALGVPYLAGKWESRPLRQALNTILRDTRPDLVMVDHLGMARYLDEIRRACPRARVVLDQHNVESDFFRQFSEKSRGLKRLLGRLETSVARRFESSALRSVDSVIAISHEDAAKLEAMSGVRPHVVPVVVPVTRRSRPSTKKPHLCYVGSLRWKPNVLGLDWFTTHVWPRVRAKIPEITLEIAGVGLSSDPSGRWPVPDAWRVPGIETVGFLEDLEPLYDRSTAMIAPIVGGSGVRLKVLEGLRAGLPTITTPDGAAGLPLVDGHDALIASSPHEFAECIEKLVRDDELRRRVQENGYAFLEAHHGVPTAQVAMRKALGLDR
jgi:glycosyltransferase involved in cell wall biosynthesis